MMKKAGLLVFVAIVVGGVLVLGDRIIGTANETITGPAVVDGRFQETIKKTVRARYLVWLPDGYDSKASTSWPLILFLHGAGSRGDDLDEIRNLGPMDYAQRTAGFPFIVVSPLCPGDEQWSPDTLNALLDELGGKYRIDPDRVYLTGLSLGGTGTWALAMEHPDRFAAIAPLCGRAIPVLADRLRATPTWVFHGDKDEVVAFENSRLMVDSVRGCGNLEVKFTVYHGAGHGIWDETYSNPALYDWFLAHKRE